MKKILLLLILTLSIKGFSQVNYLYIDETVYGKVDSINITTVKGLIDVRFRDSIYNNIYIPHNNRYIYLQFKRKFGKPAADSLANGGESGLNAEVVKFWKLIFSSSNYYKERALIRLRAEYEITIANMADSICIAIGKNGDKFHPHIYVGQLKDRTLSTLMQGWLKLKGSSQGYWVDLMSISRAKTEEKNLYLYP